VAIPGGGLGVDSRPAGIIPGSKKKKAAALIGSRRYRERRNMARSKQAQRCGNFGWARDGAFG